MPSSKALTNVHTGAGKLHSDVASAAADYQMSGGTDALLASMVVALNQEVAAPTSVNLSISAGATSVALDGSIYGPIWLGSTGETVGDIFDVVSTSNDRVSTQGSNDPLRVTSISGGSIGSNSFSSNIITLNFNGGAPGTGTYKVMFSKRMTVGSFLPGAIATGRKFVPRPGVYEDEIQFIKWNTTANAWDDAPLASLETLVNAGLNERYNRSSAFPSGSPVVDGAGDGGLIIRGGQAVTVMATASQYTYSSPQPDPYWAHFMTKAGPLVYSSSLLSNYDGGTGFVGVLQQRLTNEADHQLSAEAATLASSMDVIHRYLSADTLSGANVKTRVIPSNNTLTALNPDGGTSVDARRTIRLGVGDYFWENTSGDDMSEVALGRDMVEVTFNTGEVQAYVITTLFGGPHPSSPVPAEDQRRALVRTLAGDSPAFPSGSTVLGVKFQFVKTARFQGVGTAKYKEYTGSQTDPVLLNYGYSAVTPPLTDDPRPSGSDEIDPGPPEFFARARTRRSLLGSVSPYALAFGGYNARQHVQETRGYLRGDGAVECTLINKQTAIQNYATDGSYLYTWHPSLDGSTLFITTSHAASAVLVTLALDTDYISWAAKVGDEITIITMDTNSSGRQLVVTWPASFIFSGVEGTVLNKPESGPTFSKYHGVYLGASYGWLMTVTSYMGPGE